MRSKLALALLAVALVPVGCGDGDAAGDAGAGGSHSATLYTCVSDATIQPLIKAFEKQSPGNRIDLFRAPTGQLNARIAGDVRSGGLKADAVWACDPLTMQGLVDQGLVGGWTPDDATAVPEQYRTADYVGVAVLYMVAVHGVKTPEPHSWADLAQVDAVAVPDPSVAASALGALAYFGKNADYGTDFYQRLKDNGAKQVSTPDDVTTGVAQGIYQVGMTTANSAYAAVKAGSPVQVVWPEPGAIAIYGPIAVAKGAKGAKGAKSTDSQVAKDFAAYVLSRPGQQLLAQSGSYPTLDGVVGPTIPPGAPVVSPDWASLAKDKAALLRDYRQIFGS